MIDYARRDGWHPLHAREDHAGFRAYLEETAMLVAEARSWAEQITDPELRDLVRYPSIHTGVLAKLPPLPFWMHRIVMQGKPVRFDDGSVFYDWPFHWLTHPSGVGLRPASTEDADRWEALFERWLALGPVSDWIAAEDPAAAHFPALLVDAPPLAGKAPTRKWRNWAAATAPSPALLAQITAWVDALGPRAAISQTTAFWPELATYFGLLFAYEATRTKRRVHTLSAARRAARAEAGGDAWALEPVRQEVTDIAAPHGSPPPPVSARVLRQFGYWGRLPLVTAKGLTRYRGLWPTDPRILSPQNEARAVAIIWLLCEAFPADIARPLLRRIAEDLSVKLFSVKSGGTGGGRERSYRAAAAAIAALRELDGHDEIAALGAIIESRKLAKACAAAA